MTKETTTKRGFANMSAERQREIASAGGKAAHKKGRAHQFTREEARAAGRKGGHAVSKNRSHMADIGRKGGRAVSKDRGHMSTIGKKGGHAVSTDREHMAEIGRAGRKVQAEALDALLDLPAFNEAH